MLDFQRRLGLKLVEVLKTAFVKFMVIRLVCYIKSTDSLSRSVGVNAFLSIIKSTHACIHGGCSTVFMYRKDAFDLYLMVVNYFNNRSI